MLTRTVHPVHEIVEGSPRYADGRLSLDLAHLRAVVERDPFIASVQLGVVRPGDRVRVLNVLDVFDARKKAAGPTYPGCDGPPVTAGTGQTHVFEAFQIVGSGVLPTGEGGLMVARQSFIDFWGEGARWTSFSAVATLVADIRLDPSVQEKGLADAAVRRALIALSTEIGALGLQAPGRDEEIPARWQRPATSLPRVAYAYQIQSQGAPLDTFLYGADLVGLYPTLIDPVEIVDGALISGNRGLQTTPTIQHVNNPVLRRLLAEDGRRITLLPVLLMEGHHKSTPAKQRSAAHAVELLRYLRVEGAVFTQEGGGMSVVDQMLTIEGAEAAGIRCVAITYEMAGAEGTDTPLIYYSKAARTVVSTGNREERVTLEAPEWVIGLATGESAFGDLAGPVTVPLYALYCSTSQVGATWTRGYAA